MLRRPDTEVSPATYHSTCEDSVSTRRWPLAAWVRRILIVALLVGIVGAIGAVGSNSITPPVESATLTHAVQRGDFAVTVIEQGTLESSNNVEIRSKCWGWKTVNWVVENGAEVKKGDVLVRLDDSETEKDVDEAMIRYQNILADRIAAETRVAVAKESIKEYEQGTFVEERGKIKKEIFDAEQEVTQAELAYKSAVRMAGKGLIKGLQLRGEEFKLESARQQLQLKKTRLETLEKFRKAKELQELNSDLRAAEAKLASVEARVELAKTNLEQEQEQLGYHTIVAPRDGLVIHPKAAAHRREPDIEEGANVHANQVLLIMPDLSEMQVSLGIHESMVERVEKGLPARVTVGNTTVEGEVSEVAKVTKPATWYTGNVVKFDTVVKIDGGKGLKPGLSAEVEVVLSEYEDVLTVPVAAVVESGDQSFCWVQGAEGVEKREIRVADNNNLFLMIESGLNEGEKIVLNPVAFVDEARDEARKPAPQKTDVSDTASHQTPSGSAATTETPS